MVKKIEFSQKPLLKKSEQFIDEWVHGTLEQEKKKLKRTTIFLSEELHKKLKIEAARREVTMTEIITESVEKFMK